MLVTKLISCIGENSMLMGNPYLYIWRITNLCKYNGNSWCYHLDHKRSRKKHWFFFSWSPFLQILITIDFLAQTQSQILPNIFFHLVSFVVLIQLLGCNYYSKMTTTSRKLRHTAKVPLTVFRNVILRLYEVFWCFAKFYNFFVIFGGQTDRQTDRQT